jgi:transposase
MTTSFSNEGKGDHHRFDLSYYVAKSGSNKLKIKSLKLDREHIKEGHITWNMYHGTYSMRKIRDVLRLAFETGLRIRAIARCVNASPATVGDYLRRAEAAGLSWPLPTQLDDTTLEERLFPPAKPKGSRRPLPDWAEVHRELKRKGVTLALLWQEYKAVHPQGLQYSWFCERYRLWQGKLDVVMRQDHRAGEKLFVDYAGQTVPVVERNSGKIREAQIFVAVLGASNYTYAEATWTQALPDWIGAHVRTFDFLAGVSELVVPDNLRSGVSKAHRYEPDTNPTYQDNVFSQVMLRRWCNPL